MNTTLKTKLSQPSYKENIIKIWFLIMLSIQLAIIGIIILEAKNIKNL